MPIRSLDGTAATARLSSLHFKIPVSDVAAALAEWEIDRNGLLVPIPIPLSTVASPEETETTSYPRFFVDRARKVRSAIAQALRLDAKAANRLTFTMTAREAWYLGPRPNLESSSLLAAVRASPQRYIELMLQKELMEAAAFDPTHVFVTGGFGPGVYMGSLHQASRRRLHLAQAVFSVNPKHGLLLCDIVSKVFAARTKEHSENVSAATLAADVGNGFMVGITRMVPGDFFELDARQYPMVGVSLDTTKFRQSRVYYLNVVTEFARNLFETAGIPYVQETFTATHCVDDGYIPLEPLAQLVQPLVLVSTTGDDPTVEAVKPLQRFQEFIPNGYHVAGNRKTQFQTLDVRTAAGVPTELETSFDYLFLNGKGDEEHGSVRLAKAGEGHQLEPARLSDAYAGLARGDSVADAYTELKFRYLLERNTVSVAIQGLDCGPENLSSLLPGGVGITPEERQLQEALKRCLVELSLKECLLGKKLLPIPAMPKNLAPTLLSLIATRQIRMRGKQRRKQLVAVVDVDITSEGIAVSRVRRSPWSSDAVAAISFVREFQFLQPAGKEYIRDGQFWVVDRTTGERLTVWSGTFVPRLVLNNQYAGIEAALACQEPHLAAQRLRGKKGRFYSKSREFNLLPYYMSMYRPEHQTNGERVGARIPLEDRGAYLRVFVPPEGGIKGAGDSLSSLRDIMVYAADGTPIENGLVTRSLVQLYLHTMTNGVLVGGDNSKMSVLEKLARLGLEN